MRKGRGGKDGRFRVNVLVATAIVVGSLLAIAFAVVLGADRLITPALTTVLSVAGVLISLAGVVVAFLIFRRQTADTERESQHQKALLGEIGNLTQGIDSKVTSLVERAANQTDDADLFEGTGEIDAWEASDPEPSTEATVMMRGGDRALRVFSRDQVPLAVISDLVGWWEERLEVNGRWQVGALQGGFRATGKGNHPWFLVFRPDDRPPVVWKVSKGKGSVVAREVAHPADLGYAD